MIDDDVNRYFREAINASGFANVFSHSDIRNVLPGFILNTFDKDHARFYINLLRNPDDFIARKQFLRFELLLLYLDKSGASHDALSNGNIPDDQLEKAFALATADEYGACLKIAKKERIQTGVVPLYLMDPIHIAMRNAIGRNKLTMHREVDQYHKVLQGLENFAGIPIALPKVDEMEWAVGFYKRVGVSYPEINEQMAYAGALQEP